MTIATPFAEYVGEVLPAWIDGNDHMNMAYYVVMFDLATDVIWDALGIGIAYKRATRCGTFAAEAHILYEQEMRVGERGRVHSRLLGADSKRLHVTHELYRETDGKRAAAQEFLFLHVDLEARRVIPWPAEIFGRLQEGVRAHAALPPLTWTGRRVALPLPAAA